MSPTARRIGMFGIKLVGAQTPEFPFFGTEGSPTLMCFPDSREGRRIAAAIPIGHRSLVYLMHPVMRFWSAIEYIKWNSKIANVLEDGRQAAVAQKAVAMMEVVNPIFAKVWRCVRVLAVINNPMNAPTPDFGFHEGEVMREISEQEFFEMFDAVPWSWTDENR